jgi:hypothetical protein
MLLKIGLDHAMLMVLLNVVEYISSILSFNLDSEVGRALMVQHLGLSVESEKIEVTLLVVRLFSDFPGESRGCASDVRTTAKSRFNKFIPILNKF